MPGSYIVAGARTPIGKMSGALAGVQRRRARWLRDQGRARARRRVARRGRARHHGPGAHGRPGPGAVAAGRRQGRHPDERAERQHQQGLPLGPQHHLPRRPDDRCRRGRHRRRRRHGEHDERAVPGRGRSRRVPLRQHRARRRDHQGRPVVRVRRLPHGPRHRALHRRRHHPRAAGRPGDEVERAGRQRDQGRASRRRDRPGQHPAAQGRADPRRDRRRRAPRHHDGVASPG